MSAPFDLFSGAAAPSGTESAAILRFIRRGGFRPGQRLPTELEVARELELTRQKVREGFRELETLGVVRARQGSGRTLLDRRHHSLPALLAPSFDHSPWDVLDALRIRRVLEVGFVPNAVTTIDDDGIQRMREAVTEMRSLALSGSAFTAADRAFHVALFESLDSILLNGLIAAFWDMYRAVDGTDLHHRDPPAAILAQHAAILAAVEVGDAAAAQRLMDEHFEDSVETLRDFAMRNPTWPAQAAG